MFLLKEKTFLKEYTWGEVVNLIWSGIILTLKPYSLAKQQATEQQNLLTLRDSNTHRAKYSTSLNNISVNTGAKIIAIKIDDILSRYNWCN